MRIISTITAIGACVVALTAGCGSPASESPAQSTGTPAEPQPTEQATEQAPAPGTPAEDQAAQQWSMPNLVGVTLQDAQDQIQDLTGGAVYFTDSHDLSGSNRNQVMDANWQVCTQNVGAGAAVTPTSRIDFGVVKLGESCP